MRVAILTGPVALKNTMEAIAMIESLDAAGLEDIILFIDSPGGCVSCMAAMLATMKKCKSDIITLCAGTAASAAAIILASGTKGKRHATPNARLMFHDPTSTVELSGEADLNMVTRIAEIQYTLISELTGATREEAEAMVSRDFYVSTEEAIKIGLIDACADPSL